jgi:hypothetical protein
MLPIYFISGNNIWMIDSFRVILPWIVVHDEAGPATKRVVGGLSDLNNNSRIEFSKITPGPKLYTRSSSWNLGSHGSGLSPTSFS